VVIKTSTWSEDEEEFKGLLGEYIEHFKPEGPGELNCVEMAVAAFWRYRRLLRAEAAAITAHRSLFDGDTISMGYLAIMKDESKAEDVRKVAEDLLRDRREEIHGLSSVPLPEHGEGLQRYEAHFLRVYLRAMNELERLQRLRLRHVARAAVVIDV